jgi:predicted ArsR family transcriptional regulator
VEDFVTQVTGVGALAEPVRRTLYRYVVDQPGPVSRDQAAAGAGVPRHTAKFHLDRLVADGLLDVEFRRPAGRRGPGAGRPTKYYRRADRQFTVSLPERRYDLAGHILARAVEDAERGGLALREAVRRSATARGRQLAAGQTAGTLDEVAAVLAGFGYEPHVRDGRLELANCPFHELAGEHTALVCGLNLHLLSGLVDALDADAVRAGLDPGPNRCCVTMTAGHPGGPP